uniref:ATP-binding protein n=1 Tax=Streptomyces sp. SJL17-4 TaxID=2967224 RepID=UPI00404019A7
MARRRRVRRVRKRPRRPPGPRAPARPAPAQRPAARRLTRPAARRLTRPARLSGVGAGAASCTVTVDQQDPETLVVTVEDRGPGPRRNGDRNHDRRPDNGAPAPAGSGYGLVGMWERVTLLHGEFAAGPRPGGGFRVTARLPLPLPAGATPL